MDLKLNIRKAIGVMFINSLLFTNAGAAPVSNGGKLTIYFTRHAEKQTLTTPAINEGTLAARSYTGINDNLEVLPVTGSEPVTGKVKGKRLDEVCYKNKCAEVLSDKGKMRAMLLADWFQRRGIADELDAVYATHKVRTQQTVLPTATSVGLDVTIVQPDKLDRPEESAGELNPESTTPSECPTLAAIRAAHSAGLDTILVAGHSGTLYDIIGSGIQDCAETGLGLDTSDSERFPRDEAQKVRDYGDIWKVVLRRDGSAKFVFRKQLDVIRLKVTEVAD